jgi:hypothetical protein
MGLLLRLSDATRHALRSRHLVGRDSGCDLRIARRDVSNEHAALRWTGATWEIKDLGSRNGTWVDEQRLAPGAAVPLGPDARLAFGDPGEVWRLEEAGPPTTCAVPVGEGDDGPIRIARGELLALPDDEAPAACLYPDATGAWVVEEDGATRPVADREILEVAGRSFQIFVPAPIEGTWDASVAAPTLHTIRMRFVVSRDEEHVTTTVLHRGREIPLGSRNFHYLLVTLARLRLKDRAAPDNTIATEGWVYQDELIRMLATDANKLGVDIFRARRQLLDAGIEGSAGIVERRPMARQLRLGVADLEVTSE